MANSKNPLIRFYFKHRIISTIALIIVVDIAVLAISYLGLGWFTNHDSSQNVPDLSGMTADEAEQALSRVNLLLQVNDSTYLEGVRPGSIIEQNPKAGTNVKDHRTIYVTIRTYATKLISIPALADVSMRQGESMLRSAGIKNIRIKTIPSEYADLIYDVKWNGSSLHAGDKVPADAIITIVVGDGSLSEIVYDIQPDSTGDQAGYDF